MTLEARLAALEEKSRQLDRRLLDVGIPIYNSSGALVGIVNDLQAGSSITLTRSGKHGIVGASSVAAPSSVNYLVGTADSTLTNEIVVGTTPGGELGGTWASPTVNAIHAGTTHHIANTWGYNLFNRGGLEEGTIDAWTEGAALTPSAGVLTLGTDGDVFHVAAGNFSSIATPTRQVLALLVFDGVSVLTHGANLILQDATNFTSAAGDAMLLFWEGSTAWREINRHTATNPLTTHEAAADPHTGYLLESLIDAAGDLLYGAADNTPARLAYPSPDVTAQTTATSQWNAQTGNARKVLTVDEAGLPTWANLTAIDILSPSQVLTFTCTPAGGSSGVGIVASSGTDVPAFTMTYQGTPTNADIDIQSETYAGSPEVNVGDYPVDAPLFTSLSGPAINRGTAVGESVTFRVTATVSGQTKTKDVTVTYYNYRYWGTSNVDIDTDGEIDTFAGTDNAEISSTYVKSFTVNAAAGEYIYYIIRAAFATPTFTVGGFEGGFELFATVSHSNARGFTENYEVWRSTTTGLGSTTVVVT